MSLSYPLLHVDKADNENMRIYFDLDVYTPVFL